MTKPQFVTCMRQLLSHAENLLDRAADDKVAAEQLGDIIDNMAIVVDDLIRPVRPQVDQMIPRTAVVPHKFREVKS